MADARINVSMNNYELNALLRMAEADCRHPREQLRYLLREAARKRGLLPTTLTTDISQTIIEAEVYEPGAISAGAASVFD